MTCCHTQLAVLAPFSERHFSQACNCYPLPSFYRFQCSVVLPLENIILTSSMTTICIFQLMHAKFCFHFQNCAIVLLEIFIYLNIKMTACEFSGCKCACAILIPCCPVLCTIDTIQCMCMVPFCKKSRIVCLEICFSGESGSSLTMQPCMPATYLRSNFNVSIKQKDHRSIVDIYSNN